MWELIATAVIILHGPDNHEIRINPRQVTSMHSARKDSKNKLYTEGTNCLVNLTDGKNVAVVETCDYVEQLLREASK